MLPGEIEGIVGGVAGSAAGGAPDSVVAVGSKRGRSSSSKGKASKKVRKESGPAPVLEFRCCSISDAPGASVPVKMPRRNFVCPECRAGAAFAASAVGGKIRSGATLVVSPDRIIEQWSDEMIRKHIKDRREEDGGIGANASGKALRVAVFRGTASAANIAASAMVKSLRAAIRQREASIKNFDKLASYAARFRSAYLAKLSSLGRRRKTAVLDAALGALEQVRLEDQTMQRPKSYLGIDKAWEQAKKIVTSGCQAIREYEVAF